MGVHLGMDMFLFECCNVITNILSHVQTVISISLTNGYINRKLVTPQKDTHLIGMK